MPTVAELAGRIGGTAHGKTELEVDALTCLEEAHRAAVAPLFDKRRLPGGDTELPGVVLTRPELIESALKRGVPAVLAHQNPPLALAQLIDLFFPPPAKSGTVHPSAWIDPTARIDPSVSVGPLAVVEQSVRIGEGSSIGPGAMILEGSQLGRFVIIGPGAVIGAEGFGFVPSPDGPIKLRHVGRVVIEDRVEIGANACVDRGTLGETRIGQGAKLDNLVQVGHNCIIEKNALIAGQCGMAGSTVIGEGAMLGGQVGVADHLTVGAGAKVAAKSGVTRNIRPGEVVAGYPAWTRVRWLRAMATLARTADRSSGAASDTEES